MTSKLAPQLRQSLIEHALAAMQNAYSPYSQYPVGAAALFDSGSVYSGCNIENAAYPVTLCAERVAVFKGVSEGERKLVALAVATRNGGSPCGSCRQVMAEFGLDALVIVIDEQGRITLEKTVNELLPGAFTPDQLTPD